MRLPPRHEGEYVALVADSFPDRAKPALVDDAVAGGTGAAAPALGANATDAVVHSAIHHRRANGRCAALPAAIRLNEDDCWHSLTLAAANREHTRKAVVSESNRDEPAAEALCAT